MNLCLVYVQGVDLINDQTKRLVSLGIWINLLPVCVIYSCITLLCRLCFAYTDLSWWRGTVVERRSLAGELSLSCA